MNYYKKLLKTYVTIASLFVIAIGSVFLLGYRYIAVQQQTRSNEAVFTQACRNTDMHLSSLQEIMQLLSSSDEILKYAIEDPEQPNRYNRLQLHYLLKNISAINRLDCSLLVTKLTDDYYCSNSSSGELMFGLQKLPLSEEAFETVVNSFSDDYTVEARFIPIYTEGEVTNYIVASRLRIRSSYPLYVFAAYNSDDLFSVGDIGSYGFGIYQDEQLLAYQGTIDQDAFLQQIYNNAPNLLKKNSSFYSQHFTYVMAIEPASMWDSTFILLILCCILALLFSTLLMLYLTRKMYSPIKQTLDITVKTSENEDEFASIQNHFLTLRGNVEKLEHQLQQYHTPAQNKFIHDLLMGLIPRERLPELYAKYEITDIEKNYVTAIVQITTQQDAAQRIDILEAIYSLFYAVRSQILSAIEDDQRLKLFRVIDLNLSEQAYIFCETDTHILAEIFHDACNLSHENVPADITIALGSVCNTLSDISNSFLHASHLINQAQYGTSPVNILIHGEDGITSTTPYTVYYPLNVEQTLITSVINGKTAVWQALLKTLIDTNQQENSCNLKPLSLMLTATFDRILNAANISANTTWENQLQLYQTLQSCKTYEALYECSFHILDTLTRQLEQISQSDTQLLRSRMLQYIHSNYNRDISLLDLAEHLNMSKNYVSSLFKEVIGRNFKDYLGEYRVEKACELIKSKGGKIRLLDVAAAVGCNSSSLQRLFAHYKGMTPSEWMALESRREREGE